MTLANSPEQSVSSAELPDGSDQSIESFVRSHTGWMLSLAKRILRDDSDAEDAVQTAFANIFKNLQAFDGRSTAKTWMHRIVVNQALMTLRKRRPQSEEEIDELLPVFDANGCRIEDDWANPETPEGLLQRTQTRSHVARLIDALPDSHRIVLILRDIEELSTADVAEQLNITEANVKVRLHRARAALKKLLEPLMRGDAL